MSAKAKKIKPEGSEPVSGLALFRPSYEALMVNIWTFVILLFIPLTNAIVTSVLTKGYSKDLHISSTASLILAAMSVVSFIVLPAMPYLQLKSAKGQEVTPGEALNMGLKHFWRFYGLLILTLALVLGGLFLLIVPGLIMLRRYLLAPFYLYDKNLKIRAAMKQSAVDSKDFRGAVWKTIALLFFIALPITIQVLAPINALLQVVFFCAPAVLYLSIKDIKSRR